MNPFALASCHGRQAFRSKSSLSACLLCRAIGNGGKLDAAGECPHSRRPSAESILTSKLPLQPRATACDDSSGQADIERQIILAKCGWFDA